MNIERFGNRVLKNSNILSIGMVATLGFLLQDGWPTPRHYTNGTGLSGVASTQISEIPKSTNNHFIIEYPKTSTAAEFLQELESKGLSVMDSDHADVASSDIQVDFTYNNIPFLAVSVHNDAARNELEREAVSWVRNDLIPLAPSESEATIRPEIQKLQKYIGSDIAASYGAEGEGITTEIIGTGIDTTHPFMTGISGDQNCYSEAGPGRRSICPSGETEEHSEVAGTSVERAYQKGWHETAAASSFRMVSRKSVIKPTMVGLEVQTADGWYPSLSHAVILAALDNADADVVSISIGTAEIYTALCDNNNTLTRAYSAITNKLVEKGIVLSISAANSAGFGGSAPGCTSSEDPLEQDGIMTIAALNRSHTSLAGFSSRAPWTTLAAPGEHVPVADTVTKEWVFSNGTSFATPIVAAAAANLLSKFPDLTPQEVEYTLWKYGTMYHVPYTNDETGESGTLTVVGINLSNSLVREILARADTNHSIFLTLAVKKW